MRVIIIFIVIVLSTSAWGYVTDFNSIDMVDISAYVGNNSEKNLEVTPLYTDTDLDESVYWTEGSVECECVVYKNSAEYNWDTPIKGETITSKTQTLTRFGQTMYIGLPDIVVNPKTYLAVECNLVIDGKTYSDIDTFTYDGVVEADALNYYLPLFSDMAGEWTGLGLSNLNAEAAANVTVNIYNPDGTGPTTESKTIPPGGQDAFVVGSGLNMAGSMVIESTQPLGGVCFSGREDGTYMADVPFSNTLITNMVLPHVAQDNSWDTYIYMSSPNNVASTVTLTFIRPDGSSPYAGYTVDLPAHGSAVVFLSDIVGSNLETKGRVNIAATSGISAFGIYFNLKTGGYSCAGIYAVDRP